VTACPVADPRLVAAFPALARIAEAFLEHPKSAPTLHVTWTLTGLDVDVTGVERRSGGLSGDAQMRAIQAAAAADLARLSLAGDTLMMERQPKVAFGAATVPLPAGGFLQAVPEAEAAMVARAVEAVKGAKKIADLFCGAGTFTFPLAAVAPVLAADGSAPGIAALKAGMGTARGLKQITPRRATCSGGRWPPMTCAAATPSCWTRRARGRSNRRATAGDEGRCGRLCVVQSRDLRPRRAHSDRRRFPAGSVTPVDQFLWSAHVELVGVFRR
jgi:23S rRNA (uracil1939-C5)-methyltransferase